MGDIKPKKMVKNHKRRKRKKKDENNNNEAKSEKKHALARCRADRSLLLNDLLFLLFSLCKELNAKNNNESKRARERERKT